MKSSFIIAISLFAVSLSGQAGALSLESCAAIEKPDERLACYDTLAGRLPLDKAKASAAAAKAVDPMAPKADVVVPAAPDVPPALAAGEPTPDPEAIFGIKEKQKPKIKQLDELKAKWAKKEKDGFGKWIITLENGQVWHQIDSRPFSFINPEQWVVIYRGVFSSFFMGEPERRNGIRVERVK